MGQGRVPLQLTKSEFVTFSSVMLLKMAPPRPILSLPLLLVQLVNVVLRMLTLPPWAINTLPLLLWNETVSSVKKESRGRSKLPQLTHCKLHISLEATPSKENLILLGS